MSAETWNRPAPPGFQGLHPEIPVTVYHRHLPHWRQDGATYFVTFRLADALPQSKLHELEAMKREFAAKHGACGTDWQSALRKKGAAIPHEAWEVFCHDQLLRIEQWLDQGMGNCPLKRPDIANIVVDALHHFDDDTYELGSYVVMQNHVHAIMRPLRPRWIPWKRSCKVASFAHREKSMLSSDWRASFGRKRVSTASFAMKSTFIVAFSTSETIHGEVDCHTTHALGGCGRVGKTLDGTSTIHKQCRTDCQSVRGTNKFNYEGAYDLQSVYEIDRRRTDGLAIRPTK